MVEEFLIAEKYVPEATLNKVAKSILRAQYLREESWDGMRKYNKTDSEASCEAVKEFGLDDVWCCVISGWLSFMWNDCQSWAEGILSR